jgi:Protein kinase domain
LEAFVALECSSSSWYIYLRISILHGFGVDDPRKHHSISECPPWSKSHCPCKSFLQMNQIYSLTTLCNTQAVRCGRRIEVSAWYKPCSWRLEGSTCSSLFESLAYHRQANILINNDHHACLADFGLTSIIADPVSGCSNTPARAAGTVRWMAPEILVAENFSPSTLGDVYAVGMTFYEVSRD